ncbi:MAG: FtsX-like permease family protein, partial [Candidatus Thorarchaeota archaeon]
MVDRIKGEFVWEGSSTLESGQILISERLVYHFSRTYGLRLRPGMIIGADVLLDQATDRFGNPSLATWSNTEVERLSNLTIAGIYKLKSLSTLAAEAFPSLLRSDPWPEHMHDMESVLGLEDSVMVLKSEFEEDSLELMTHEGYFEPKALFRASIDEILEAGIYEIEDNLLSVKEVAEERYSRTSVIGAATISDITTLVETYERGQMFTLVAVPVMLLSIFITIFTAESSLARRKVEISVLRSKGASFNQITASIMWEAGILSITGFFFGLTLAIFLAPVLGSSISLFNIRLQEYVRFFSALRFPPMILVISAVITMYLPGLYLYQIERRIDVHEVGVPLKGESEEKIKESRFQQLLIAFLAIITLILIVPTFVSPQGITGVIGILFVAGILIVASYLGSRVVQLAVSSLIVKIRNRIGERVLYVVQSLRRRRGKFVPLMVILTLSLTSATMMLMESSSFQSSLQNDVIYSYGADIRLDSYVPYHVSVADEIEQLDGVNAVTPVMSHIVSWQSDRFFLKGIRPLKYLEVGSFGTNTFPNSNPNDALLALQNQFNGAIVSESYANRLNKTVGDTIRIRVLNLVSYELSIVATMNSAPGFGYASTFDSSGESIASNLGFQVAQDGFILVNYDYLSSIYGENEVEQFLIDADLGNGFQELYANLTSTYRGDVRTPHWNIIPSSEVIIQGEDSFFFSQQDPINEEIQRFISGLQGITLV